MKIKITPHHLCGSLDIIPSKSYSHRAIIAASLAKGKSEIKKVLLSEDIKATIAGMQALGASIDIGEFLTIKGNTVKRNNEIIDCVESGSTVRFLIPISLCNEEPITFIGRNKLVNRPLNVFLEIFNKEGIHYQKGETELPLKIWGKLHGGEYNIRGDISSQFITGLLFALPLLDDDSVINITTPLESRAYIDLTIDILEKYGIKIYNDQYKKINIIGKQTYKPYNYTVEGDFSQAAFFIVAGLLGSKISLKNLKHDSLQGDKKILEIILEMGGMYKFGDELEIIPSKTKGLVIDLSQNPDLAPIITVLASLSEGETRIINASRLKIKESDRIVSISTELNKLGAKITMLDDGMIIKGVDCLNGGVVDSWNDHRVAMSLAIASIRCKGPLEITNMEAINKSYPQFLEDFRKLGGIVDVIGD